MRKGIWLRSKDGLIRDFPKGSCVVAVRVRIRVLVHLCLRCVHVLRRAGEDPIILAIALFVFLLTQVRCVNGCLLLLLGLEGSGGLLL